MGEKEMKPYYQDDFVTIYHGDCLDVMKEIPNQSVDIIWTDPPYGHNNNNGDLIQKWESALGRPLDSGSSPRPIANDSMDEMKTVLDSALIEAVRVLKRDCCCCCCCCGGGGPKPTFAWVANRMDSKGLSFFHAVVWDKGGLGMGWRYRRNYEMVMVAHRKGGKLKWEWNESGEETANVVRIGKIIPAAEDHPTPKPQALVNHFLMLHSKPGDALLDPFMGAGTTLRAAKDYGVKAIGIEIDEHWCEVAANRMCQEVMDFTEKA